MIALSHSSQTAQTKHSCPFSLNHLHRQVDYHLRRVSVKNLPPHLDRDDLRQEMFVAVFQSQPSFDPARSSQNTFQDRVIRKNLRKQLSSFRWRKNQGEESLEDEAAASSDARFHELSACEKSVFQNEVRAVVETMPDDLRLCCELLMYYTPKEAAAKLRISTGCVMRRMQSIRTIFCNAGMEP